MSLKSNQIQLKASYQLYIYYNKGMIFEIFLLNI